MNWEYKILDIGNVLRGEVDDSKVDLLMNELGTEESCFGGEHDVANSCRSFPERAYGI